MMRQRLWTLAGLASVILTLLNFTASGDVWGLGLIGFGIMGTIVVWRVPGHVTGPLMITLSGSSALTDSEMFSQSIPATDWAGAAMPVLMGVFVLTFPDGVIGRRWRPFVYIATGLSILGAVLLTLNGDEGPYVTGSMMVFVLATIVDLVIRYRSAIGLRKAQMRLVVVATVLVPVFLVLPGLVPGPIGVPDPVYSLFVVVAFTLVPIAVGAAIVRYRLYDVDRIISRTVSYAIVVTVLASTYVALVWITTSLLQARGSLAIAASTLAVAAAFNPLRKRVQRAVDRRFNRSNYQVEAVSERFSTKLRGSLTVEEVIKEWMSTVAHTFQPQSSGVWIKPDSATSSETQTRSGEPQAYRPTTNRTV